MTESERALVEVGCILRAMEYAFVTPTPATHARINARPGASIARDLRDVFGWSRPARAELFRPAMLEALRTADALEARGELLHPRVRFSTLGGALYAHSAYPTETDDAVFFGPDTYRFCTLVGREVATARRVIDIGAGSGAGALSISDRADRLVLADTNLRALSLARVNAELAGVTSRTELCGSDVLAGVDGAFDLVIANPPYLVDASARMYRHGGDHFGTELGVRIVREALARLAPGGRLIVYTGAPITRSGDAFRAQVAPLLDARGAQWTYAELDPDVFGEELGAKAYEAVERIAAVALCANVP